MRCGCTNPCPTCPLSEYLDQLQNDPVLPDGEVPLTLLTRTFNIPAGLPGMGINVEAELDAQVQGENDAIVSFWLQLDGGIMQSLTAARAITIRTGGIIGYNSGSVFAGVEQLAPGDHTLLLVALKVQPTSSNVIIVGAAMRTELVRAPNLTVTLQNA